MAKINTILIFLTALVTAGALGVFVYTLIIFKKPGIDNETEFAKMKVDVTKSVEVVKPYTTEPILVNLIGSTSARLRFLSIVVNFVAISNDQVEKFETNKIEIKDMIIDITSKMRPDELNQVTGKILLNERIKTRLNEFYKEQIVKDIFFSEYVVQ
jgi:flagellar FliL protein